MRVAAVLLLLGILAFANGYLHSKITHVLQPGEFRNFYIPVQTGSIRIKWLEGTPSIEGKGPLSAYASPRVLVASEAFVHGNDTLSVFASYLSDTNDWYPYLWNQNETESTTVTFEVEVHEPITATGRNMNLFLIPYAFQYVHIPAEVNHGLSFHFDVQCEEGNDDISIYAKSASAYNLEDLDDFHEESLWENEDVLLLIQNTNPQQRNCTLSIVSKATVVLISGVNSLTVDNSTSTIGTRYTPTSPMNNVVRIQTDPSVPIYHDQNHFSEEYYLSDGQNVQIFVFDTSNLNNGDQLNVTVTPIPTVVMTNRVQQTFQCVNKDDHHVFALVGDAKSGAVLEVTQSEGVGIFTYYTDGISVYSPTYANNAVFTQFASLNGVVWVMEAICSSSNTSASITAHLPVLQTLSIGKNVLTIGEEESYYVLPAGPGQTVLGVRANSSNAGGWYAAQSFRGYDWEFNGGMKMDIVYAYRSFVISPAWYFTFYRVDVPETVELTLTSIPMVTLESGKPHSFIKPDDDSYGNDYWTVAKLESSNGLGHAVPIHYEYDSDSNDNLRISVDGLFDLRIKRSSVIEKDVYTSERGSGTWYFAVRTDDARSPVNLTATFAPVTTAMNDVIDYSSTSPSSMDGYSYHTFVFPAKKRYNSVFKSELSQGTFLFTSGVENAGENINGIPGSFITFYTPDSLGSYFVTRTEQGQNTTAYFESIATIGLCNSQYDCNGHGSCATVDNQCACTNGYSGDWCDVPPSPTDDNDNSGASQMMIATFQLMLFVAMFLFVEF